jgi:hypothetical protein
MKVSLLIAWSVLGSQAALLLDYRWDHPTLPQLRI